MNLSDYLLSISNESQTPLAGERFDTSKVDETILSIESAAKEYEQSIQAFEAVNGAILSIESKIQMVQGMRAKGVELDRLSAIMLDDSVRVSLESRGLGFMYEMSEVPSNESYNAEDYSVEAEEKKKGLLSKLYEMLKKAFEAMKRFAANQWDKLKGWNKNIGELADKIQDLSNSMRQGKEPHAITHKGMTLIGDDLTGKGVLKAIQAEKKTYGSYSSFVRQFGGTVSTLLIQLGSKADYGQGSAWGGEKFSVLLGGAPGVKSGEISVTFVENGNPKWVQTLPKYSPKEAHAGDATDLLNISKELRKLGDLLDDIVNEERQAILGIQKEMDKLNVSPNYLKEAIGAQRESQMFGKMSTRRLNAVMLSYLMAKLPSFSRHMSTYWLKFAKEVYRFSYLSANAAKGSKLIIDHEDKKESKPATSKSKPAPFNQKALPAS